MVLKLSSLIKALLVLLTLGALALFAFRYVSLERRVSDMDFRVMTVNKQLSLLQEKPTPTATPSPVPTPKLKVK